MTTTKTERIVSYQDKDAIRQVDEQLKNVTPLLNQIISKYNGFGLGELKTDGLRKLLSNPKGFFEAQVSDNLIAAQEPVSVGNLSLQRKTDTLLETIEMPAEFEGVELLANEVNDELNIRIHSHHTDIQPDKLAVIGVDGDSIFIDKKKRQTHIIDHYSTYVEGDEMKLYKRLEKMAKEIELLNKDVKKVYNAKGGLFPTTHRFTGFKLMELFTYDVERDSVSVNKATIRKIRAKVKG